MGDANDNGTTNTPPSTTIVHPFFTQQKRRRANSDASSNFNQEAAAPNTYITGADDASDLTPTVSTMEYGRPALTEETIPNDNLSVPPTVRLNDISDEELEYHLASLERNISTETVIHSGINGRLPQQRDPPQRWDERERENLVYRLDRCNDKKCRYLSHKSFLTKCLANNLTPNGLRVYVEPSIGNRNDEFLDKWHSRLDKFSQTLTNDVIGFCDAEIMNSWTCGIHG